MANNQYDAILLLDESTPRHTDEEVTIESPCPSTPGQPICLDDADDVIDLTDDSEMTTSEQSDSLQNNTSDNELQFPMHLFLKTEVECVDELPHDINGFKLYKIKCSPQEWVEKSQDLRYLKMNTLRRKKLIGMRKVGRCLGSLYCMSANCPFKGSAEGKLNTTNFQNVSRHKVCFSCGNIASRKWCDAHKMTEYCRESETLTVYHIGMHKCPLKKRHKNIQKVGERSSALKQRFGCLRHSTAEVGQAVANGDIREAQRRAMQLSYANVRSEKAKISWERNPDEHSLEAVGILKQATDKETSTSFTKLITLNLMGSQIMYLKVVPQ